MTIRRFARADIPAMLRSFRGHYLARRGALYARYAREQQRGRRIVLLATAAGRPVGYGTLVFRSRYGPFRAEGIPEIVDLNVLPGFRKRGIAGRMIDALERVARDRGCRTMGIGVGLTKPYGSAQRLYVGKGYVPDGRGITHDGRRVKEFVRIRVDDGANLWLLKPLRA